MRRKNLGFTLIELMIAVAIVGILAAVALPSYRQHVVKSNRRAVQAQMMDLASREQQYLLANRKYTDDLSSTGLNFSLSTDVTNAYSTVTVTVTAPTSGPPTFLLTATPTGNQTSDGNLTLTQEGVKGPDGKW
jgi:type IV pilus assembly protein PilE